ncbi:MAG: hypothetical protein GQ527_11745 [Bacteroidales bacterium]|nr:hypothetical protein [Bacteroidales bacterium]
MENKNVFWGVLLVAIGSLFVLDNMDLLDFNFAALVDLWPVLLVVWGVSILPIKKSYKTVIGILIAVGALVYASTSNKEAWWNNHGISQMTHRNFNLDRFNDNNSDEEDDTYYTFEFDEELDSKITNAILTMDIAAGKFRIDEPTTDHLIAFEAYTNIGPYNSNVVTNGDRAEVFINMEEAILQNGTNRNRANIKLNPAIVWDLNFDVGAADFRGDFRKFKINEIDINGGASSIKIKISDLQDKTSINLDAAAASIKFDIPMAAGCKLDAESFLVDLDLDDFTKNEDGDYVTKNFDESKQKIYIDLDAAISKISIRRY